MPDPNTGESEKDFISRCIPIVMKDGTAQDDKQAFAVCKSMFDKAQGKSLDPSNITLADATKIGSRHNKEDQAAVQTILDKALFLGGTPPKVQGEVTEYTFALMSADKSLVSFGTEVKALGAGKVAGYLVRYGDQEHPDLTGEYFTPETDFGDFKSAAVYYQHGADKRMGKRKLGNGELTNDDVGMWIEAQLNLRDEYEQAIYRLAENGKLGWSSGTAAHLVDKDETGKIIRWPLGLDASLTPTPAEPRNATIIPLKSYLENLPTIIEDNNMEISQEQLTQMMTSAVTEATKASVEASRQYVEAALKSLPAVPAGGFAKTDVIHDEADTPFKSMGEQLSAVKQATLTQGRELAPRLKALNIKQLGANELIGSEGGFLLEPTFAEGLLTPLHDTGAFSSKANKIPIGPNSNGVTVRAVDEVSRVTGSRWGGIQGYRLAEAGTKQPSQPTFRLAEMRLKKYAVLCYATEELLQDTTALAGIIQQGCSEELDFMVNDDIFEGAGAAGCLGFSASACAVSVAKEAGQAAATVVTQNIFKMWSRMHPSSKKNAIWYINTDVTPQLYQLSLSVGTGGMPMYMMPGSLPNAPSGTLMGKPVIETEFNQTLGTVGDIVLADMSQYAYIDRDVQAASSIHVQFLTDQIAYRFVYRADGQPKLNSPITPFHGTNTLSPFVTLATRA